VAEKENKLMDLAKRAYEPVLAKVLGNGPVVLTSAIVLVVLSGLLAWRLGSEFIPNLNEGDIAIQALRIPATSLSESLDMQKKLESGLKAKFPEIDRVFARTGTAEIASDPMPQNMSDGYIMLKPQSSWPTPTKSHDELLEAIQKEAEKYPGNAYEFSQPIQLRFNELISGVRSDVAVKIYGDDMDVLTKTAQEVAAVLQRVRGASEVKVEQTGGLPMLSVNIDREKTARYGLNIADVQAALATATGGREAGTMFEGDRRFAIVVRLPEELRSDIDALRRLPIPLPAGESGTASYVPLSEVADMSFAPGPNQVSRENGKRRIVVSANVRGRDVGSFVPEAEAAIARSVKIPAGYWTSWGGTFEQLQSATRRLKTVVPLALFLVLTLLFVMFGNLKDGLLVFTGIPFALTGGIVALSLRGIPLSITAAVGFIALSGVAVLNGLVMISFIRSLRENGMPLNQAIVHGALTRLRPVLMTALVASLGFVPMAIATGTGAEVQRPLATVVIGGILSSTALTLLVLPLLYRLVHRKDEEQVTAAAPAVTVR
jgi:cobalt-zinc-cadmium resistance protein CzcA